tara:strand:- start:67 stop:459 length:393 start_codon:yes stop_codon:yes gene_type:complete
MSEIVKEVITPRWLKIKEMYEAGTNGSKKYGTNFELGGELNVLSLELVDMLGEITLRNGWDCIVEDIEMDLWKKRVWSLIENAGLLDAIESKDEDEYDEFGEDGDYGNSWIDNEDESIDLDKLSKEEYGF